MSESCSVHPFQPTSVEDELTALSLQLEEIDIYAQSGKGKYAIDRPPDIETAYTSFHTELQEQHTLLADQQFARSMAAAVHSDGTTISALTSQEIVCREDRLMALRISHVDPEYQRPHQSMSKDSETQIQEWMGTATESQYAGSAVDFSDDEGTEAGPSMSFAERQANVLEKLSMQTKCAACHEMFYLTSTISLACKDRYCVECLKNVFFHAAKDEAYFPARCHGQPIPLDLVSKHLSAGELAVIERASIEFSTNDRIYCSNRDCRQFIPPEHLAAGTHEAVCERCNTSTCGLCNNAYHHDSDCPEDHDLRQTRELAVDMGWQTCYCCSSIVMLQSGCNHMTCRCRAEFCYECGTKWKECTCRHSNPARILERAEEIVDRDAVVELQDNERQRRVHHVRAELEQNHECEHSGRFRRVEHGGRRGFRCEMCDVRHWKYILQCRHCYVNVCEDCRRNRV